MSIRIRRFESQDEPGIARLNDRLARHGIADRVYPEASAQPSEQRGDPLTQEAWVAVDEQEVRGGMWLHEHEFQVAGETVRAAWLKYPVSESLTDRAYGGVPGALIIAALRRQPRLMALGMGGLSGPLAVLLARLGWSVSEVPFFIFPARPRRIMRELTRVRRTRVTRRLADIAAFTGLPSLAGLAINGWRALRGRASLRGVTAERFGTFEGWADDLWQRVAPAYPFIARRDASMLNHMLGPALPLTRIRVRRQGADIGWVSTILLGGSGPHPDFGRLRVGMIVDALALPEDAVALLGVGVGSLREQGADLIVCNHAHPEWIDGLRRLGFVRAPGNFAFACSREMSSTLRATEAEKRLFLTRGDCDGPPVW